MLEVKLSKYDALGDFLQKQKVEAIPMTFLEIERVIGTRLPASKRYPAWWSNYPLNNVMTKIWLEAGFYTEQVDVARQRLVFRRGKPKKEVKMGRVRVEVQNGQEQGMSDVSQEFGQPDKTVKKPFRSPLWGALKGTFTIEPGWDLTKPALDPDELEEMYANLDRTADMIEQGLKDGQK